MSWLLEEAGRRGISLEPSQAEKLHRYALLVLDRGTVLGLSGRKRLEEILGIDVLDSLLLVPHARACHSERSEESKAQCALLDIGPGAGFPGIPLKIALPDLCVTLLEAKQKAVKFLEEAREECDLRLEIFQGRAEERRNDPKLKECFDLVTGRAVAPMKRFLPWAVPFLKPGGRLILQKGKKWEEEMKEAQPLFEKLKLTLESVSPGLQGDQKIAVIRVKLST